MISDSLGYESSEIIEENKLFKIFFLPSGMLSVHARKIPLSLPAETVCSGREPLTPGCSECVSSADSEKE